LDSISFGQPDQTWNKYSLTEYPLKVNGAATDKKAVMKEGNLVGIFTNKYVLLPNEEAVKQADAVAAESGLVPFDKFSGPWVSKMGDKTYTTTYGQNHARVNAMYAIQKEYQVNGEEMYIGVSIHNSIDGSKGFGAGIFTFRQACKNMVIVAGQKNWSINYSRMDHGKTLETVNKRHTAIIDPQTFKLKTVIAQVMTKAQNIIKAYEQLATEKATEDLLKSLGVSRLSKNVLPDYIAEEEVQAPENLTVWEAYNDITAQIWHNQKSDMTSKTFAFNTLHQIIPLTVRAA